MDSRVGRLAPRSLRAAVPSRVVARPRASSRVVARRSPPPARARPRPRAARCRLATLRHRATLRFARISRGRAIGRAARVGSDIRRLSLYAHTVIHRIRSHTRAHRLFRDHTARSRPFEISPFEISRTMPATTDARAPATAAHADAIARDAARRGRAAKCPRRARGSRAARETPWARRDGRADATATGENLWRRARARATTAGDDARRGRDRR